MLPKMLFLIIIGLIVYSTCLAEQDIVLLDPPPDGYRYAKPEPINVGGRSMWIANILEVVRPSIWERAKDNISWLLGGGGILGSIASLLIVFRKIWRKSV